MALVTQGPLPLFPCSVRSTNAWVSSSSLLGVRALDTRTRASSPHPLFLDCSRTPELGERRWPVVVVSLSLSLSLDFPRVFTLGALSPSDPPLSLSPLSSSCFLAAPPRFKGERFRSQSLIISREPLRC
jgi:hypothetical protein